MAVSAHVDSKRFLDMTIVEKLRFLAKFMVFICSFGFVFPRILSG